MKKVKKLYTERQKTIIERMVWEFSLVHDNAKRFEKLAWYDLASGIHNIEKTTQIMKDLNAI